MSPEDKVRAAYAHIIDDVEIIAIARLLDVPLTSVSRAVRDIKEAIGLPVETRNWSPRP